MTVTASGCVNPKSIVSGASIRVFDTSTGTGEVVVDGIIYINDPVTIETYGGGSSTLVKVLVETFFSVGDMVMFLDAPTGISINTTYYVKTIGLGYFTISLTPGGTAVTNTEAGTFSIYKGCRNVRNPSFRPFPVTTSKSRNVVLSVGGSSGDWSSTVNIPFYTTVTALTKPTMGSTFKDTTIFIYNSESATCINRNWSDDNHLFFTKLTYTNYLTKTSIAKFTVVDPGTATATELDLLLAGSALNVKKDNYVAIIQGDAVVWGGHISRSVQDVAGLYTNSVVKAWTIDCEGDITRMNFQNVKTANKGECSKPAGGVISLLTENAATNTPYGYDINWNTNGIRSNEGLDLDYKITDASMLSQFLAISSNSDFDWRTRPIYARFSYTNSGTTTYTITATAFGTNDLKDLWIVIPKANGAISFGKATASTNGTITATITPTPESTGTMLVIRYPTLDFVSDLSTPSKVATFLFNAVPSTTHSNGYGFNDKTDRSNLATKVTVRGKSGGRTITSTLAAVTPWDSDSGTFEKTATITERTEGEIIETHLVITGDDAGVYFTLNGWGYLADETTYFAFKRSGLWVVPSSLTRLQQAPTEKYSGDIKVTEFKLYASTALGYTVLDVGDLAIITDATVGDYADPYGSYYIKNKDDLGYTDGDEIYIGGETIHTVDCILDATYGYQIRYIADGTANHRDHDSAYTAAHGVGSLIWLDDSYSESSPDADSPVGIHGVIHNTFVTDQEVTNETLEIYATLKLIATSYYYRKATMWCVANEWYKTDARDGYESVANVPIEVGDLISCLQNDTASESDTIYGQYQNLWQVVSVTFDATTLKFTVELGDFERNNFTQLVDKTAALNRVLT